MAQNILCFFYNDCKSYTSGMGMQSEKSTPLPSNEQAAVLNQINVYPNPANNFVAIELPTAIQGAEVEVFTIAGNKIFETTMQKPIFIWDTNNISAGTYIVMITVKGEKTTRKVVISH